MSLYEDEIEEVIRDLRLMLRSMDKASRHPHADLIHAWAEGAEIEYKGKKDSHWYSTSAPQWDSYAFDFRIKQQPKWYEDIPENGMLCWVGDDPEDKCIRIITCFVRTGEYPFIDLDECAWRHATPFTKCEIEQFLNKAPT